MPHIAIKLYPGRTEEVKKELADKLVDFMTEEMKMEKKYFSLSIEEIEKENWQAEVVEKIDQKDMYIKADF